jgi:hypothetical protein
MGRPWCVEAPTLRRYKPEVSIEFYEHIRCNALEPKEKQRLMQTTPDARSKRALHLVILDDTVA